MAERWQHELRKLKTLDPPAGLWDRAMQGPRRELPRARKTWPAIAAALAVAVLAVGTFGLIRTFGTAPASGVPGPGGNGNLYPLGPPGSGVAEKTTVAGAQAIAGFPVPVPSTAAASRASLTQAWVSTHGPGRQVAVVFDNGKIDILMHRATYQSDLRYFHAFVAQKKENGTNAVIGKVNGRPALITTPNTNTGPHSDRSTPRLSNSTGRASISAYIATPAFTVLMPCWPLPAACGNALRGRLRASRRRVR